MLGKTLNLWVAQSESWRTFVDFKLPKEDMAKYVFLERPDDFYINLFGKMFEIISDDRLLQKQKSTLLSIGKGLEIYSLNNTSREFEGVNLAENMLFVSGLYYLADYSASSYVLANLFSLKDYDTEINKFLLCFLKRNLRHENDYTLLLKEFLSTGNIEKLNNLRKLLNKKVINAFYNSPDEYASYKLASAIIKKFSVNNVWLDLVGDDPLLLEFWKDFIKKKLVIKPPLWDLFPSQRDALKKGILESGKTFSLQMPTSAGKTAICELIIFDEIKRNPGTKVLFLAPFRALASELKTGFNKRLAELGIKSKSIYGGNATTQSEKIAIEEVDLLVSTPEKFMAIESVLPELWNLFSMIICDEGHLLDDSQRGLSYELLLSKFRNLDSKKNRFIFLSAIIPNIIDINKWLGGDDDSVIQSNYRPTELNFAFLKKMERVNAYYLDVNPTFRRPENYQLYRFLTREDFQYRNNNSGRLVTYNYRSYKTRAVAVALKSVLSGTVALFAPHKGENGVKGLVKELMEQLKVLSLPNPIDHSNRDAVEDLKEYFTVMFGRKFLLTQLVDYGTVYHHGDLPQNVREVIEEYLRDGYIRLVVCTNTLAEGVNLPIKTMVIYSSKRFNGRKLESMPVRDLKNIVGRAGRAGQETRGLVIVVNPSDFEDVTKVINNVGNEPVKGSLFEIVQEITRALQMRWQVNNELLENQSESFKQLIDSIDLSIIDLLGEEINADELSDKILSLIEKTYAYYQSTDEQKAALEKLFKLRGERLKPYIESSEFKVIKRSGSDIRLYENIMSLIDVENDLWTETSNSLSDDWIDYLMNIVLNLPQIQSKLAEFNEANGLSISNLEITQVIKLWMAGKWYKQIANKLGLDVEQVLKIFSNLIGFHIQMICSNVIRVAQVLFEDSENSISQTIIDWPQYLLYGLKTKLELDLVELGFIDRIGTIALADLLEEWNIEYDNISELRAYILREQNDIISELDTTIPQISLNKVKQNIVYLQYENIL